jgi:hypothetical protein
MDVELLLVFGCDGSAQPPEDGEEEGHLDGCALHLATSPLPSDHETDSFLAKPNHDILKDLILMNLAFCGKNDFNLEKSFFTILTIYYKFLTIILS